MFGEEAVEATNEDATSCKKSAVQFGYYEDPYLWHLMPRRVERKAPEIHLGYFTRVTAIQLLLEKIATTFGKSVQILDIGAGFDTLYWRLKPNADFKIRNFIEIDFPGVTSKKCAMIKRSKELLAKIVEDDEDEDGGGGGDVELSRTDLHGSSGYHVIAADFTQIPALEAKLSNCNVDYRVPTIFLAECVLVYVDPAKVDNFLKWIARNFKNPVFVNHEQLNMGDRFGQVMLSNLRYRGCDLPGIEACTNHQTQIDRFLRNGWTGCKSWTMNEVYGELPPDEISRVEKIEHLDERELMQQLFDHYCLNVAWKVPKDSHCQIEWDDIDWWN